MLKQIITTFLLVTVLIGTVAAGSGNDEERKMISLRGKVIDANTSEGLAGVVVEVEGTDIKVFTDFDGNFTLPALPEGSYNLKSAIVSYNELKLRNIKVNATNTETLELKLHTN